MKNYLGKLNNRLLLERIPKNLNHDIHLYYLGNEDYYFYMVVLNLCKENSIPDGRNSTAENKILSRFTIFQIRDKTAANPAVDIGNLLGEVVNSNYDIAHMTKTIEVSYYQPDIGKVLEQRTNAACLGKEAYDKKLNQLNICLRNYLNGVNRTQFMQDNGHLSKRHFQNNRFTPPQEIQKLTDELYHGSFIVPIKYIDCTNTERLPKFLYNIVVNKAPTLLGAPVEDIRKGEITIYSDSAFDFKTGKFAASCVIFIKGLQGIFCSVDYITETEDSTLPELCAMNDAFTILNDMFDIQGSRLTFLSDNENLLRSIKKAQNGEPVQYSEAICTMLVLLKDCQLEFEKANEGNEIFRLVDRESKFFRKVNNESCFSSYTPHIQRYGNVHI